MVPWYEVEDYMHLEGVGDSELSSRISDGENTDQEMEKQELIVDFLMFQGVQDREKTGTVTIRQIRVIVHPGMPA